MGKDTKYLTLAAIVLMGIASLIVLSSRKKTTPAIADNTLTTTAEDLANTTTTNKDLYKDATDDNGATPQAVKDAYTTLSGGNVEEPHQALTNTQPSAYEAPNIKIKRDKLTEKGTAKSAPKPASKKAEAPLKPIKEDTGPVYIVQTGINTTLDAAKTAKATLIKKGYAAADIFPSGKNYLVYAGKFQNKASADELKKRLDKAKISAFVKELK